MRLTVTYSRAALHEAARYIWDHNPSVRNWHTTPTSEIDVAKDIRAMFQRDVKRNRDVIVREKQLGKSLSDEYTNWGGTGGYYVIYSLVDDPKDDLVEFEAVILVDASVGNPNKGFVTEDIDS